MSTPTKCALAAAQQRSSGSDQVNADLVARTVQLADVVVVGQ